MRTLVTYALVALVIWFLLFRKETFAQPVLTELDFGRGRYTGEENVKQKIAGRDSAFETQDGARIEYFFQDDWERDPHDPLHVTYKRLDDSDINPNKYGPRSWDDKKRFDDTGAMAFMAEDKLY